MKKFVKKLMEKIPFYDQIVLPYHRITAWKAANKFNYPAAGMKVIGVTGTNGKTTTCFMIHKMLEMAGKKVGLITTVAYGFKSTELKPQKVHMTTADADALNKMIAELRDAGVEYLVLEVTSHALAQYRTFGIPIDVAVMTNVTHEHLDYHKTFMNYVNAKRRLFKCANHTHKGQKIGVINADDDSAKLFENDIKNPITYGIEKGDLRARQVKTSTTGIEYFLKFDGRRLHIKSPLAGKFNVYNSLAAVAVGLAYKLSDDEIERGIASLTEVEGRMEHIDAGQKFDVIVDFAHTPDGFRQVFNSFRPTKGSRVIALFGAAGGRRDPTTRPERGEIAAKSADIVILTEDDSYDTPIDELLEQMAVGARDAGKVDDKNLFLIPDRHDAIKFAFETARDGDVVLLLGKGHEKTLERKTGAIPWNEAEVVREIIEKMKN